MNTKLKFALSSFQYQVWRFLHNLDNFNNAYLNLNIHVPNLSFIVHFAFDQTGVLFRVTRYIMWLLPRHQENFFSA